MLPSDWISRDRLWAELVSNHTTGKTLYYLFKNTISHSDKIRLTFYWFEYVIQDQQISARTPQGYSSNSLSHWHSQDNNLPATDTVIKEQKVSFDSHWEHNVLTVRLILLRHRTKSIHDPVILSAENSSDSHKKTQRVLNNTDSVHTFIRNRSSSNNNLFDHDGYFISWRLDQNRTMTIKSIWVQAHQDEKKIPGQILSDAALRSIKVDSIAEDYLLDPRQPQTSDNAAHGCASHQHMHSRNQGHWLLRGCYPREYRWILPPWISERQTCLVRLNVVVYRLV